jgi:hypothetical protein
MRRNTPALCLLFLAGCALAFTSVALNAAWWTASVEVLSTNSTSTISAGTEFQLRFYQTKLKTVNGYTGAQSTKNYDDLSSFDDSLFNAIRGINFALIVSSAVLVLFGLSSLAAPRKAHRAAPVMSLLSLATCLLAAANLLILAWVPDDIESSIASYLDTSNSNSNGFCSAASFTWNGYTFTGETIRCGNIWKTYEFALTSVSGATSVIQYQTEAGSAWWWTFGAMIGLLFGVFAAGLTKNAGLDKDKKEQLAEEQENNEHVPVPDQSEAADEAVIPDAPENPTGKSDVPLEQFA